MELNCNTGSPNTQASSQLKLKVLQIPNLRPQTYKRHDPESSQGTFIHLTCNYRLEENQISEQEPAPKVLLAHSLPSLWIYSQSPASSLDTQFGHSWLYNISASAGRLEWCPSWDMMSPRSRQAWLGSWRCSLEPLEEATCNQVSHFLDGCSLISNHLHNMQNLFLLESNSCPVTKLSSGKASACWIPKAWRCFTTSPWIPRGYFQGSWILQKFVTAQLGDSQVAKNGSGSALGPQRCGAHNQFQHSPVVL